MHVLWLFFTWPAGAVWGNVFAMPLCGIVAAFAAFLGRDRLGRALSGFWHRHFGHRAELDDIHARLDAHANLLDPHTPGGLAVILDEVRRAVAAAESAHADIQALGVIAKGAKAPRRGPTEMRKTGRGKAEDAP